MKKVQYFWSKVITTVVVVVGDLFIQQYSYLLTIYYYCRRNIRANNLFTYCNAKDTLGVNDVHIFSNKPSPCFRHISHLKLLIQRISIIIIILYTTDITTITTISRPL